MLIWQVILVHYLRLISAGADLEGTNLRGANLNKGLVWEKKLILQRTS